MPARKLYMAYIFCFFQQIGLDFWENITVARLYNGAYGTEIFGNRAVDLIMQHDQTKVRTRFNMSVCVPKKIKP